MPYNKNLALLSYLTVCIVWGSTYLAIKVGVSDMPFLPFAGLRFSIAGALILIFARIRGWQFPQTKQDYGSIIFAGVMLLFVSNGLVCWAEQTIDSGLTALLIASVPLFMALIEAVFPKEHRLSWVGWAGLVIGFVGVVFLISPHFALDSETLPAVLGVLAASLNWAAASIYLKRRTISGSMMPQVGLQMFAAGVVFLIASSIFGDISIAGASASGIAALLYLLFIGSILAYTAFNYMIKALPAAKAGTYAYINPLVAVVLGALILKETVTAQNVISAVIIIVGVVLVQLAKVKPVQLATVSRTGMKP
jgi:drug/metabolite transporter (DMT)-like permease